MMALAMDDGELARLRARIEALEQAQGEEALRASEAMLRRSQAIAHVGSWEYDLRANRLTWSDEVYRIFGLPPAAFGATYEAFLAATHPDDRAAVDAAYRTSVREGSDRYEIEHRVVRADGTIRHVHERCEHLRDADGQIVRSIGMVQDITERVAAEQALRESAARYRAVMMQTPDCLFLHDLEGRLLDANPAAVAAYGYSREELLAMRVVELDPDYVERAEGGEFFARLRPGEPHLFEARHRAKDGRIFPVEIRVSLVSVRGETLLLALARDLSAQRRAEAERARLEEQVRQSQKLEAVGRLAGGVAHDFNNLLCAILGNAALALDDLAPEDPLREAIEEITAAANRAAELTRQLLAFSRKQVIEPKVVNLGHLVGRMKNMLRRLLGEDIQLEVASQDQLGRVRVDPGQMEQIIVNLAVNARDSMPGGGTLRIQTADIRLDEDWCEEHGELAAGAHVMLAVTDTGSGMSPEVRGRIFEPFFTTKEGKGTGLGLATVFGIVRQHGGAIEVESEPGQGSTFRVFFPRVRDRADTAERGPVVRLPRGSETVLLVEDEDVVRVLAARVLERQGYRVLTARTAEEALVLVAERPGLKLDLLLTDVVMPGRNGRELAALLVERLGAGLRVLFTSGYTDDVIAHHGVLEAGVRFIAKPYTPEVLAVRVRGSSTSRGRRAAHSSPRARSS
jgi:PAS domain S-box-containing protein